MKKTKQTAFKVALALVTAFAVQSAAPAASPASPKTASLTKPYALKISLVSDASSQQIDIPNLQVDFVNATQYELAYRWTPLHTVTFLVEYKAASADPGKEAGWKRLTPVFVPSQPRSIDQSDEHVEKKQIQPGQEQNLFYFSTLLPLIKEGYYRITATLTLPSVSEFRGTDSPSILVHTFDLAVSSKPLVIRHTATGFAEVPAAASTAPAH